MPAEGHGLLDTNILILRRQLDQAELPPLMSISAITLAELSAGPHHTDDPRERARRLDLLQRTESAFDPLPFDAEAARAFGQVCAAVLAAGSNPPPPPPCGGRGEGPTPDPTRSRISDLMIASVAMANRLPLYTTNPGDFDGLGELLTVVAVTHPATRKAS